MLRLATHVTTSPTSSRLSSSATSATAATSGPRAPNRVTISSTSTAWPVSTPASTSPTAPPAAGAAGRMRGGGHAPQVLVGRARGRRVHCGAGLGQEVLDDHLLHVAVAAVAGGDGLQGLEAVGPALADADEDPGGEGDGQLTRRLERGQAAL